MAETSGYATRARVGLSFDTNKGGTVLLNNQIHCMTFGSGVPDGASDQKTGGLVYFVVRGAEHRASSIGCGQGRLVGYPHGTRDLHKGEQTLHSPARKDALTSLQVMEMEDETSR